MVYCGKPSKACAECRQRRTKCDALSPSCSQCIRAGRVCQGYRDPNALRFRDASQALSKRHRGSATAKERHPGRASAPVAKEIDSSLVRASNSPLDRQFGGSNARTVSSLPLELGTSPEDQATCFFFRNYVLNGRKFHTGNFQYLADLYLCEDIGNSLTETVTCLGLVGLANFWKTSNIMSRALAKYNSAMRLVSSSLINIDEAKSDQTLVAVILFGLYETNTCSSPQSMRSRKKHITGATALLSLRGIQQLRNPIGHDLFIHLRTLVISNCLQRHSPVPSKISEWSRAALEHETEEEASVTRLSGIAIKFCNIRASMSSFHDYNNSEYLVACLQALDQKYTEWLGCLPNDFLYATIPLSERCDEVFSNFYHMYSSIWTATIWNHYRSVRILVHEILLDQSRHILQHPEMHSISRQKVLAYESQALVSKSILLQLSHDICTSVPFYLGISTKSNGFSKPLPKAVCGNLLMWPLYVAACTAIVSDMMRDWVAGRLRMISETMGIRQAASLAYTLSIKQDLLEWEMEGDDQIEIPAVVDYSTF